MLLFFLRFFIFFYTVKSLLVREKKISLFCNNFTLIEFYTLDNLNSSKLKNESSVCQYGDL